MLDDNILNKQIVTRRTFVIGIGKLSLLFLLAGRMFYMQFIKKMIIKHYLIKIVLKLLS